MTPSAVHKTYLTHKCFVCDERLYFTFYGKNYHVVTVKNKAYLLCRRCKTKDLKEALEK